MQLSTLKIRLQKFTRGIRAKLLLLGVMFLLACIVFIAKGKILTSQVSIGSPLYERITAYRFIMEDVSPLKMNLEQMSNAFNALPDAPSDKVEDAIYALDDYRMPVLNIIAQLRDRSKTESPEFVASIDSFEVAWKSYNDAGDKKLVPLLLAGKTDEARAFESQEHGEEFKHLMSKASGIRDIIAKRVDDLENKATATVKRGNIYDLIISAILIGLVLFFILIISSRILSPIHQLNHTMKDLAEGDGNLSIKLTSSDQGELGELAHWFNIFVEKLRTTVTGVANHIGTLTNAAEELAKSSNQVAQNSEHLTIQVNTVRNAASAASENVESISNSAQLMSGSLSSVAESITDLDKSLNHVSVSCNTEAEFVKVATRKAEETLGIVQELGTSVKSIDSVVNIITKIAQQTNLLALNATIEAASAGEAGKGFAVVAKEVKELSRQTAQATTDITQQISAMQQQAEVAVQAIHEISRVVYDVRIVSDGIVSAVDTQNQTVRSISVNISQLNEGALKIAQNVSTSAQVITEIAQGVTRVSISSQQAMEENQQIKQSAQLLDDLASQLRETVQVFKT